MTAEQFAQLLNKENRYAHDLGFTVRWLENNRVMFIQKKQKSLLEDLSKMLQGGIFPLVDKKLGLVFGLGESNHGMMRTSLFRYHNAEGKGDDVEYVDSTTSADEWLRNGMGYYFSSMGARRELTVGNNYREDRYDKDVFLSFRVDRTY